MKAKECFRAFFVIGAAGVETALTAGHVRPVQYGEVFSLEEKTACGTGTHTGSSGIAARDGATGVPPQNSILQRCT